MKGTVERLGTGEIGKQRNRRIERSSPKGAGNFMGMAGSRGGLNLIWEELHMICTISGSPALELRNEVQICTLSGWPGLELVNGVHPQPCLC